MPGTAIGNTLSTIVINVLSSCVYEGKQKIVDTVKLNKLKKEIDEWIEDYCQKNDGSVLTSSAFQNYVYYQNPILKIYNYVNESDIQKPLENIFIGNLISDCKESVLSSGRTFSVEDNSTVRDFFVKVLYKYKEFLSNNLDMADKYGLYVTGQIIKSESDGIIKEVQKVEDITKKLCDMLSQEDISENRTINIYFSLCNFLWQGHIEEVCSILHLIKSRNQELKGIGIYTVDIVNFLINIKEPVKNIIRYMKQMLELRLMVIINKRTVDYISEYYLTAGEKEQEEILIDWDEFLAGVELVGKEYKSIFTQISTDIMRSKFSESETYESDVWKIFARYVFHYNGFFFRYGFNENGEFEIRTYKRVEDAEE